MIKNQKYILQKPLPTVPVGWIFKPTSDGTHYYNSMTDDEINMHPDMISIRYSADLVENNPAWFKPMPPDYLEYPVLLHLPMSLVKIAKENGIDENQIKIYLRGFINYTLDINDLEKNPKVDSLFQKYLETVKS